MKRLLLILLVLLLALGTVPTMAQGRDSDGDGIPNADDGCPFRAGPASNKGCPESNIAPQPAKDSDGDGLPDSDDQCPTSAGPRDNRGCPVSNPPPNSGGDNPPPSGDNPSSDPGVNNPPPDPSVGQPAVVVTVVPPFTPPVLPTDGCYVTPATDVKVNVRKSASLDAEVIGYLQAGVVYQSEGYVMVGADIWFVLNNYENNPGEVGYASRSVLLATTCSRIAAAPATDFPWQVSILHQTAADEPNTTIEYCVYQEVQEYGVFQQVCYEIEIPEGCVVHSSEAGVFTIDCGAGEVSVNPLFDDLPAEGLDIPTVDGQVGFVIGVMINPADNPDTSPAEYCVYRETQEVGVFKEVCVEVEVPEGCWLETIEAGVFTTHCRPELGGEVSFTLDTPIAPDERPHADWRNIFGELVACETGQVWWLDYKEPVPGQGPVSCVDTFDQLPSDQRPDGTNRLIGLRLDDIDTDAMPWEAWLDLLAQFCHPQSFWATMNTEDGKLSGGCVQPDASMEGDPSVQLGLTIVHDNPDPTLMEDFWLPTDDDNTAALPNPLTPDSFCLTGQEPFATWSEDSDGNMIPGSVTIECVPVGFWD